ncbi:hypothetical protein HAX54_029028 [Datura stramonium]|uniref:Uncharacterized protein n=1 Tax=Datura stramonium TaxID=4076 RepID=A0ABS8V5N7_DATST|nr:hypothetical protein [Datura stramonium]
MPHTGGSKSIATLMDKKVLGNEKSGYVHGLRLGPTTSVLWGHRSSLGGIIAEDSSSKEKMQPKLLLMRRFIFKYASNECMPENINGDSSEQIPDVVSGQQRVPQTSRIPSAAENTPPHGTTHIFLSSTI